MPESTPIYDLPYPLGNETAAPRLDIQALALATEAALAAVEDAIPDMPDVPVTSVNGETGAVVLTPVKVGAATATQGAIAEAAAAALDTHKAETMPHRFTDGGVVYKYGWKAVNGELSFIYEAVV